MRRRAQSTLLSSQARGGEPAGDRSRRSHRCRQKKKESADRPPRSLPSFSCDGNTQKKKFAPLRVSELRCLRQLEDENRRLKGLVADLTLDKHMLSEALRKKG